jgi:hypothetical protein
VHGKSGIGNRSRKTNELLRHPRELVHQEDIRASALAIDAVRDAVPAELVNGEIVHGRRRIAHSPVKSAFAEDREVSEDNCRRRKRNGFFQSG